jgi:predicted phage tail protein
MPLSEQEQRLLDEMERHLMSNDTDVVSAPSRALSYRNIVLGSILVLAGLGALVAGVSIGFTTGFVGIAVGVLGFLLMVGGVIFAVTPTRGAVPSAPAASKPRPARTSGSSFMDRMNERWDRRHDGP